MTLIQVLAFTQDIAKGVSDLYMYFWFACILNIILCVTYLSKVTELKNAFHNQHENLSYHKFATVSLDETTQGKVTVDLYHCLIWLLTSLRIYMGATC